MQQIYLDHYSATPLLPEVFEAMKPYFIDAFGNASSLHHHGLVAKDALKKARAQAAAFVNAGSPDEIIFTADGTEAANLAIKGTAYANQRMGNHLVVAATEHPSVLASIEFLEKQGFTCTKIPVDRDGIVDPQAVQSAITDKTILIATHHVNHEIGAIQPIKAIGAIAAEKGIPFYVDAEASAGWLPIDVRDLGATLLSFSPHRFHGPKGVGVLYRNLRTRVAPIIHGGMQEGGRRAGIENIPAIVGAGVAMELASRDLPQRAAHVARLQRQLWEGLRSRIPQLHLLGPDLGPKRIATNLNIAPENVEGEGLLLRCDLSGIALASGSSCLSKSPKMSHVLSTIGLDPTLAKASVIMSLGKNNTPEEIELVIQTFTKIVTKFREMLPQIA